MYLCHIQSHQISSIFCQCQLSTNPKLVSAINRDLSPVKCAFFWVPHVQSASMEELWFMSNTASSHQGVIGVCGFTFRQLSCVVLIHSLTCTYHIVSLFLWVVRRTASFQSGSRSRGKFSVQTYNMKMYFCDLRPSRLQNREPLPPPSVPCTHRTARLLVSNTNGGRRNKARLPRHFGVKEGSDLKVGQHFDYSWSNPDSSSLTFTAARRPAPWATRSNSQLGLLYGRQRPWERLLFFFFFKRGSRLEC